MVWACPGYEEAAMSSLISRIGESEGGADTNSFGMVIAKSGRRVCTRGDMGLFFISAKLGGGFYLCCFKTPFYFKLARAALHYTKLLLFSSSLPVFLSLFSFPLVIFIEERVEG